MDDVCECADGGHGTDDGACLCGGLIPGHPIRLSKYEARRLQKMLTMQVDYPELEPEDQELYDKLGRVL